MRVRCIFSALHLYPSDKTRNLPTGAGTRGLRHKSRHKKRGCPFTGCSHQIEQGWGRPFDSGLRLPGHHAPTENLDQSTVYFVDWGTPREAAWGFVASNSSQNTAARTSQLSKRVIAWLRHLTFVTSPPVLEWRSSPVSRSSCARSSLFSSLTPTFRANFGSFFLAARRTWKPRG
jgi:hypothetical protein